MPDRRASYCDAALDADGKRFGAAFSDMLASGYSVALGEAPSGRLLWAKDIPFVVQCVALSADGSFLGVGGENGVFWLLDASRTTVCRANTEQSPLTCLAVLSDGSAFSGGQESLSRISRAGERIWHTLLDGSCEQVAASETGALVAALVRRDETSGQLVFLDGETGHPLWDTPFDESRPTGVSLSPSGTFCAVSLRDGTLFLYETETDTHGHTSVLLGTNAAAAAAQIASEVQNLQKAQQWPEAFARLRAHLLAAPSDAKSGALLGEMLLQWPEICFARADTACLTGDFARADAHYAACLACDPHNAEAVSRRQATRQQWAQTRKKSGLAAMNETDWEAALAFLRESLEADETQTKVRELLETCEIAASESVLQAAQNHLVRANYEDALSLLMGLKERGILRPEVAALLRQARTGEAFALGNALYSDRQYPAALFQYKKVLRFDAAHKEAAQKIAYIQNFLSDTQVSDRFGRLE